MGAYGIPGDPAGMRALAAYLRGQADFLASAASAVVGSVRGMEFEGPAASAFRQRIGSLRSAIDADVSQLNDVAGRLLRAAADVEAAQAEAARQERLREEAEARRSRAAAAR
jgi:hypothetical protein